MPMESKRKRTPPQVRVILAAALISAAILTAGCTGPLTLKYKKYEETPYKLDGTPTIHIVPFTDEREEEPLVAGTIKTTVAGMVGPLLTLEAPLADFVTDAVRTELEAAGFTVTVGEERDDADYLLTGKIKQFHLEIAKRDTVGIEVAGTIINNKSGKTVWTGTGREDGDRFAGVGGNTKKKINKYLSRSLATATAAITEAAVTAAKERGGPEEPTKEDLTSTDNVVDKTGEEETRTAEKTGRLLISTEPARSKVHINGVYYGLTPITLELEAGIYDIVITKKGYTDETEKVALRKGYTTLLEIELTE